MTASDNGARLYTTEILGLAVELANYPITETQTATAEARSRSCGSTLKIAIDADRDGAVESFGLQVSACAIGQASAAIFARHAKGRTAGDFARSLNAIELWLRGARAEPGWPDMLLLDHARAYPARYGAILLPWRAAIAALSKDDTPR